MFDVFIFFIPLSQTISVINRSGACAGVCACNHAHQIDKTGNGEQNNEKIKDVFKQKITGQKINFA